MSLLIVTPILNEKHNILTLADQLTKSTVLPDLWVVVDDGSTDGGGHAVREIDTPFPTRVVRRENGGGLIGGSAFTAWQYGIDDAISLGFEFDYVMKLDADVNLAPAYLQSILECFSDPKIGLAGGVLVGRGDREQTIHVPGPVKLYSRKGFDALSTLPRVVGFDVMDELAIKSQGLKVRVKKDLNFSVRRPIGASQGMVHGRRRNGLVCAWTGYWKPYFALHALRYVFRKPYVVGTAAMIYGFLNAPESPYPRVLRTAHTREQKSKLEAAVKNPYSWYRKTYGLEK